ncbi:glyoxylate reductase [Coccidioides immitis RS]|uniref:Glyoxylate reductase n=3 Tax=Coccidioides immitis TaxID=5501 RepID=J3KJK1_COCIM|nr:glyoxylate reductase [Coccidioides immitis RS]EAS36255.3 glyoxylate reductase [Coccidioides immitis RS]KMP01588.1 glyoxylate reductase [Coccidioides immitis RMSCC 2394]KMU76436.1 glyoxylate reductase [Coccidioides immitis RMSCC 3703]
MGSDMRPKVLLLGKIDHAHTEWNALSDLADLIEPRSTNREDFIEECRSGCLDGVLVAYRTFGSVSITGLIDEELVNALPKSMRFLAHCGAGYDQIDVHACSARSPPLLVSNVPTAVDDSTADVNMFLIIGTLRNFNTGMQALREGKWKGKPLPALGHDPQGKTLGILGMGGIGRNLKKKAEAFGMKIIYHNRRKLSEELSDGGEYVSFDELLAQSDVLSLNLPLNKNTQHIIGAPEFAKMKDGIIVVNTARGAVMDEEALVQALDSGKVLSAGLDVFEDEPNVHPGLLRNPNVMLVPHMGTWSVETQTAMEEWAMDNIRRVLETGKLKSPVPEQADM